MPYWRIDDWGAWAIYNRSRSLDAVGVPARMGSPDQRNFLAHSGFERNAVEAMGGEEILLKYSEASLKCVKKYSASGLLKLEQK